MESYINAGVDLILALLEGSDIDWVKNTYQPLIRKTFQTATYCGSATTLAARMVSFALTFVEAFVFQEEVIPMDPLVRDAAKFLDIVGITADSDRRRHGICTTAKELAAATGRDLA